MNAVRIIHNIERAEKEIVDRFRDIGPATVHEAMGRQGAMDSSIKPIYSGMKICGTAVTVQCHMGDNIMLLKSIDVAQKGDIIVVDMGDIKESDGWGELTSMAAQVKGIGGLVTNCSVRDGLVIKEMSFPIFARGLCMKGTVKESLGWINHPIDCGGVRVCPGDIILGDDDGVVVIPKELAADVYKKSEDRENKEAKTKELLLQGKSLMDIYGFNQTLARKGCTEE